MENAVNNLEAMKADSDINCLSQRLNNEFVQNDEIEKNVEVPDEIPDKQPTENRDALGSCESTNPSELVQKLGDVKKEYKTIVQQVAELQEAQKDAFQEVKNELNSALQLVLKLSEAGAPETSGKPEELAVLEELLKTCLPWGQDTVPAGSQGRQAKPSDNSSTSSVSDPDHSCNSTDTSEMSLDSEDPVLSPSSRRQNTGEFVEVTEEEFETVSELIRGRVKLTEVNSTYRILWDHFKTHKHKSDNLTPEDMFKLGLKVTGATGQAKLKVLRALKILKLTTKGEVSMS